MTNQEFFINSWKHESAITAKAFRSLPADISKLNVHHHPKFRSPWEIVNHIGPHANEVCQALKDGKVNLVNEGKFDLNSPAIYISVEAAAKDVEDNSQKLMELVKNCSENDWLNKKIPAFWGPMKIMEVPLMQFCWMMFFDTIHHRGQLSSYYRIVGAVQPELYGPTAEVEEAMMAKAN
ncbi:MAG: hypothetical protein NT126_09510 [Bacteroidetes bacterium]|nr:hypothetical protein [Bacteroidota bacterium]